MPGEYNAEPFLTFLITAALNIGLTVDVSVPVAFAAGAARVTSVRFGKLKLAEHLAVKSIKSGGHTIAKHVNIPEP